MFSFNSVMRAGPAAAGSLACVAQPNELAEHSEVHTWPSDAGGAGRQPAPLAVQLTPDS